MLKRLLLAALLFAISSGPAISAAGEQTGLLNSLVGIALRDNPELLAARARWQIYRNRIVPAAALDDPTLSFSLNNYPVDTFRDDETPMTGKVFKLSQRFPFPGKLAARQDAARLLALWYKGVYEDGRLALARQVKIGLLQGILSGQGHRDYRKIPDCCRTLSNSPKPITRLAPACNRMS